MGLMVGGDAEGGFQEGDKGDKGGDKGSNGQSFQGDAFHLGTLCGRVGNKSKEK